MTTPATSAPARRRPAPQDRRPKAPAKPKDKKLSVGFTGENQLVLTTPEGDTYTSEKTIEDCLTFGLMREYGHNDVLMMIRLVEALFAGQPAAMAVLDPLGPRGFFELSEALSAAMQEVTGTGVGES